MHHDRVSINNVAPGFLPRVGRAAERHAMLCSVCNMYTRTVSSLTEFPPVRSAAMVHWKRDLDLYTIGRPLERNAGFWLNYMKGLKGETAIRCGPVHVRPRRVSNDSQLFGVTER